MWEGCVMDKSLWVKIVWLGAVLAIPAAILAVQKPEPPRVAETHRVMAQDQPVSVDISDLQIEGAKPVESAAAPADLPKAQAMHLGAEKITMKGGGAEPAPPKTETAPKERSLTTVLAPVAGPQAAATAAP
jgi:hypothetical protein